MRLKFLLLLILLNTTWSHGQSRDSSFLTPASSPDKDRIRLLNYTMAGTYALGMTWLYTQWYKDYPKSSFHFFNDNAEWKTMDKYAHAFDAYIVAKALSHSYRWAGYDNKRAALHAAGIAYLFQASIEVFDGFSEEWGFSGGDIVANTFGTGLFLFQQLHWKEQRIVLKYSFHQTKYSKYRPQLLGSNVVENMLKDYNGQTFWLTVNPKSFFKSSKLPSWLSLAFGVGAEGMTGGRENPTSIDGEAIPAFERYRQYYLSIDFDLARLNPKSRFLNSVFKLINVVHLPAPAIEFIPGRKPLFRGFYF